MIIIKFPKFLTRIFIISYILSFFLHIAVFMILHKNMNFNSKKKKHLENCGILINLLPISRLQDDLSKNLKKNMLQDYQKESQNNTLPSKDHVFEKKVHYLSKTFPRSLQENFLKEERFELPKISARSSSSESPLWRGFIELLELPESLLGQNFFPRKYRAIFQVNLKQNSVIQWKLLNLEPFSESVPFLDKIVLQAFLKKLNQVDLVDLKNFFSQEIEIENRDKNALLSSSNIEYKVDVILEFKESN